MIVKKWLFIINQKVLYYIIDLITFQTTILRLFLIIMSYGSQNLFSKKCNPIIRTKHFLIKMTKRSTFAKKKWNKILSNRTSKNVSYFIRLPGITDTIVFCPFCVRVVFGGEEKRSEVKWSEEKSRGEPSRAEESRAHASWVQSIYLISNPITKQKDTYLDCRLLSNSRL